MTVVRAEVRAVALAVVEDLDRWRAGYRRWQEAVAERDRVAARAERRLAAATGGLGLDRWRAACRRRRVRTVADARLRARAVRARPAVEEALADQARLLAVADARVGAARRHLADVSRTMASYGRLGAHLTGLDARELHAGGPG